MRLEVQQVSGRYRVAWVWINTREGIQGVPGGQGDTRTDVPFGCRVQVQM